MPRFGILLLGICAAACNRPARESDDPMALRGSASQDSGNLKWDGHRWQGDYFDSNDWMLYAENEGVYLIGRKVGSAGQGGEGRAEFSVYGRSDKPSDRVSTKSYAATRPAEPQDLAKNRWCYIPETVLTSPSHMLKIQGPPNEFLLTARRESWRSFRIQNTSDVRQGRVDLQIDDRATAIPLWAVRVRQE